MERLLERELVVRQPRRPGQKEERYEQVLGGGGEDAAPPEGTEPSVAPAAAPTPPSVASEEDRLERLERELTELRAQVASLREALGED